ncbi:polysaccharide deacetylase family protein [Candidatus Woesearchaeota archaeon]|nr:polysaccharide deacetylase family protein [Candidatus Woesearchaeota archaeon]
MLRRDFLKILGIGSIFFAAPSLVLGKSSSLYLTIDDGPSVGMANILKELKKYDAKATFFIIGQQINGKGRDLCLQALGEGHRFGNHTYSHISCSRVSLERCLDEIQKTDGLLNSIYSEAKKPFEKKLFRFPYGDSGGENKANLGDFFKKWGYSVYLWDVDSRDWEMGKKEAPVGVEAVLGNIYRARPGDVVLLHDREKTARLVVPRVLDYFSRRGYRFDAL